MPEPLGRSETGDPRRAESEEDGAVRRRWHWGLFGLGCDGEEQMETSPLKPPIYRALFRSVSFEEKDGRRRSSRLCAATPGLLRWGPRATMGPTRRWKRCNCVGIVACVGSGVCNSGRVQGGDCGFLVVNILWWGPLVSWSRAGYGLEYSITVSFS